MSLLSALDFLRQESSVNRDENTSQLDIELMIFYLLNLDRVSLYSNPPMIDLDSRKELSSMISRRNKGEPLAYILGLRRFWNINLNVNEHVLVPRPETETLIEIVLDKFGEDSLTVLDTGTGSGAIALALANERNQWHIFANEKSEKALKVAKKNRQKLKVSVNFIRSDWLDSFGNESFNLIVSNPPYIDKNDPCLKQDGVKYEPLSSLVSKQSGLNDIKKIILNSYNCLKKEGYLFLEHASWQTKEIARFFFESNFLKVEVFKDLNGDERVSAALKS